MRIRRFLKDGAFLSGLALTIAVAAPVAAQTQTASRSAVRGWGPRVGLGDNHDQFLVGLHFDMGRIGPYLHFRPNFELGFGDHHTVFAISGPVHYRFAVAGDVRPYAGGGLTAALDRDDRADDTDLEIALDIIGGLEWRLARGNRFLLELSLVMGNIHDLELVAGWTFR